MAGKEMKRDWDWRNLGWSLLGTFIVYLLLQFVGALLLSREVIGEENVLLLVAVFAGVSVLLATQFFLRKVKKGRLGVCLAVGGIFVLLIAAIAVMLGEWKNVASGVWGLLAGSVVGGALSSVLVGKKRKARIGKKR